MTDGHLPNNPSIKPAGQQNNQQQPLNISYHAQDMPFLTLETLYYFVIISSVAFMLFFL